MRTTISLPPSARRVLVAAIAFSTVAIASPAATDVSGVSDTMERPNAPVGAVIGAYSGKVAWAWNPDATNPKCDNTCNKDGRIDDNDNLWFQQKNNNAPVIQKMLDDAIMALAAKPDVKSSWNALFASFNSVKGRGARGYRTGEKIFVRINRTSAWGSDKFNPDLSRNDRSWRPAISETNPFVVLALLRQIIAVCGIAQEDVYVGDPMRQVYKEDVDLWAGEFPRVHYLGNRLLAAYASIDWSRAKRDFVDTVDAPEIHYSDQGKFNEFAIDKLYSIFARVDYVIAVPSLKAHARSGISIAAKGHYGSHTRPTAAHLHGGLMCQENDDTANGRFGYNEYRTLVDLMGHRLLGRNTLLVVVDGLYPCAEACAEPDRWDSPPFYGTWASSILVSQDQVSIESVCLDFLKAEYRNKFVVPEGKVVNRPNWRGVDDYLFQAADPLRRPAGIVYNPDGSGPIPSLGIHEHWNNPLKKMYSRNLGRDYGIDLVSVPPKVVGHAVRAKAAAVPPVIDGVADDACWKNNQWYYLDQTWIPYGARVDSTAFYGRFKVSWSDAENLLYFLVEITDSLFVTGYEYAPKPVQGLPGYADYDDVELFLDEDHSGGDHTFTANAFAYHITGGNSRTEYDVLDIAGTSWNDYYFPNYKSHVPQLKRTNQGNRYTWEFSVKVYNDTYNDKDPERSRVKLSAGKEMGMTLNYCDDNEPAGRPKKRDFFFSSEWVDEKNSNRSWQDATLFGTLILVK